MMYVVDGILMDATTIIGAACEYGGSRDDSIEVAIARLRRWGYKIREAKP